MTVYEQFKRFFEPGSVSATADRTVPDEERIAAVRDMRAFFATDTYKEFRRRLTGLSAEARPVPGMGIEAAAGCAYRQAAYQDIIGLLDAMIAEAEEKIDGLDSVRG